MTPGYTFTAGPAGVALGRRLAMLPRWGQYITRRGALYSRDEGTGVLWRPVLGTAGEWVPDVTDAATLGYALAMYLDARTTLAAPDPVLTLVAVYGLRDLRTVEALVAALECAR